MITLKKRVFRVISLIMIISLFVAMNSTVFAATSEDEISPQASNYITSVYASISGGGGSVRVYFDIAGTGKMTSLGATVIQIKNSAGTIIKTYASNSTSGMLGYNKIFHSGSVTYTGVLEGASYYAVVYFRAEDSTGYDTSYYVTDLVKA